ncbi:MAG: CRTAC1 family protein, partial [Bryobacteraceae bacterium]
RDSVSRSNEWRSLEQLAAFTCDYSKVIRWSGLFAAIFAFFFYSQSSESPASIRLRNIAEAAGLRFVLENHPTGRKHMIETMPGGVAAFDYNNDDLPDIFFTNGAAIPSLKKESPKYHNRLFRNEGNLKFREVTAEAGVAGEGYSMGAAAADYDNDGLVDLFVAGVYRNILYRNLGGGKFEDITAKSGIKSDRWSVAAGWFDYDNDGLLDLFVVNYAKWTPEFDRFCGDSSRNLRVYCHPKYFEPIPNQIYRNRGDGSFEDVSESSGIAAHSGRGMSVAFADYDLDGRVDAFVTNDNLPNFLFHNLGKGKFEEAALLSGVALLDHGKPVASMGADFRDYDNDGLPDINVTALFGETFPLFRNAGGGLFKDATYGSRIGPLSTKHSGWSNALVDLNNDGWKDLFTANSHVNDRVELFEPTVYKEPNSVFVNAADGTFRDVSGTAGESFNTAAAHRGSAFADFDNDGLIDIVVSALGGPAELWLNESPARNWLRLKLRGKKSNRDGMGARVRIGSQWNRMTSAVGYASSSHDGVHFGLGEQKAVKEIEIQWPGGSKQTLADVKANQTIEVTEP